MRRHMVYYMDSDFSHSEFDNAFLAVDKTKRIGSLVTESGE